MPGGLVAGIDGTDGGWIAAVGATGGTELRMLPAFDFGGALSALVDAPIGLPERGDRFCDLEARRLLGPRRSSVFPAPLRSMLAAADHRQACAIREAIEGKRCSVQLFGILGKIREVDAAMTPALQRRVREGHPEVSFAALNGGAPLRHYKGTPEGRSERLRLLRRHFPDVDEQLSALHPRRWVADAIDAHALLWSALRAASGAAIALPAGRIEVDARGLRQEIVY